MKKGLWLNRGLCFRFGTQFSTEVGVSWVVHSQKKAFESQVKLINHLKEKFNSEIDIVVDTFSTKYDNIVKSYFDNLNAEYNFLKIMDPGNPTAFNRALYRIVNRLAEYDYLIITRNDMIFKDPILDLIDVNHEEIKYPFVLTYEYRKLTIRYPNIDDKIPMAGNDLIFFPKKYFHTIDCFKKSKGDNHDFIMNIFDIDNTAKVTPYINTYHDSDPMKDWNPLYRFVGRGEVSKWITGPNLKYPDDY